MAVIATVPLPTRSGSVDSSGLGSYTRAWRVRTDTHNNGPIAAMAAVGVAIGDAYSIGVEGVDAWHEADAAALARSIRADEDGDDGHQWTVTVEYGPGSSEPTAASPLEEAPSIQWDFQPYQKPIDVDSAGNPIVNSAGDPFADPLMRDDQRAVLRITRNEATYDAAFADSLGNKLNNATFYGQAAKKWKSVAPRGTPTYHAGIGWYYRVEYEFHFNPDTWQVKVLDQGYRYKSGTTRKQILVDNAPATSPVFLNGSGAVLSLGGTPTVLTFDIYASIDYSVYNLE